MSNITKIGFGTNIPMNIGVEDGMITVKKLSEDVADKINSSVSYTESQELTDAQKQTARNNISAVKADDVVRYDAAQSLTDAQKEQARENIGSVEEDGTYPEMSVGNLIEQNDTRERKFIYDTVNGNVSVTKDSTAEIQTIKGNTLVWNQLVKKENAYTQTINGITCTTSGDGTYHVYGTCTEYGVVSKYIGLNLKENHKYLIKGCPSDGSNISTTHGTYDLRINNNSIYYSDEGEGSIFTAVSDNNIANLYIRCSLDAIDIDVTFVPMVFDLTLMFGAGNEPATVEEFEKMFPLPYYEYNAGTLLSNTFTGLKTTGFNQWDEDWENGGIDTGNGNNVADETRIRCKNYIKIMPSSTYYVKAPVYVNVFYYDANKNFLSVSAVPNNSTFTTLDNACYIRFRIQQTTYNHDICINLSWSGYRNGEYESYWDNTLSLPEKSNFDVTYTGADGQTHIASGLKSAGTAYDEQTARKDIRRIGVVDLGSLNWLKATYGNNRFYTGLDIVPSGSYDTKGNLLCLKYETLTQNQVWSELIGICAHATLGQIFVYAPAYTDAAALKASLAGVLLYYELAEPVETDVNPRNMFYPVSDFGTEQMLPENTSSSLSTPFRATIKYSTDYTRELVNLPRNYVTQHLMDSVLSAVGSATNKTFSKTYNDGTGTYTVTESGPGTGFVVTESTGSSAGYNAKLDWKLKPSSTNTCDDTKCGQFVIGGKNTSEGHYTFVNGFGCYASGQASHAEGRETVARGMMSHAEGLGSMSFGNSSHAEGEYTVSVGVLSHSDGDLTTAYGDLSCAIIGSFSITIHITGNANVTTYSYTVDDGDGSMEPREIEIAMMTSKKIIVRNAGTSGEVFNIQSVNTTSHTITLDRTVDASNPVSYDANITTSVSYGKYSFSSRGISEGSSSWVVNRGGYAKGANSFAGGNKNRCLNNSEVAFGMYNKPTESSDASQSTIATIGNGAEGARSNAIELKKNGDLYLNGIGGYDGTNAETAQASQRVISQLIAEVNALKNSLSVMGSLRIRELTTDSIPNVCGTPMVLYGPGIPSESTVPSNWDAETMGEWTGEPMFIGQQYVNTSASSGGLYYAVNTTDSNGWKNANA